ncbi:60S Ribosomal protein [Salix suchowensis]|nr:60S Ribosomal protein [Salix suchowensis]
MAQQQEGWPLGLHPLNVRVGIARNGDFSGSISLNTLLTGSPTSSTDSSSDLDTEDLSSMTRAFSLGSLIGVSNLLELSRNHKDKEIVNDTPSLGHFLAVERRASSEYRRNHSPIVYGPRDELELAQLLRNPTHYLLMACCSSRPGQSAAPKLKEEEMKNKSTGGEYAVPVLFSCMCGQPSL